MAGSKPAALPLGDDPSIWYGLIIARWIRIASLLSKKVKEFCFLWRALVKYKV
jgi:hypothetical protein